MVTITDLLGFNIQYDEDGNIEILDLGNHPGESKQSFDFFKHLELLTILILDLVVLLIQQKLLYLK